MVVARAVHLHLRAWDTSSRPARSDRRSVCSSSTACGTDRWRWAGIIAVVFVGLWARPSRASLGGIEPGPIVLDEGSACSSRSRCQSAQARSSVPGLPRADVVRFPSARFELLPGSLGVMADDAMAAVRNLLMRAPVAARLAVVSTGRGRAALSPCRRRLPTARVDTNSPASPGQLNALSIDVSSRGGRRPSSSRSCSGTRAARRPRRPRPRPTDDDVTQLAAEGTAAAGRPGDHRAIRRRFAARG